MITFQDKVSLNTDPSIPEINKITDQNINDLKAGINTNETNINNIKSAMAYSTTEVKTNEVWIDGKPIYMREKIFDLTSTGATSYDISNYNIDTLVDMRPLFVRMGSVTDIELPYVYNTSDDMARLFIRNNSTIEVRYQIGSVYQQTKVRCLLKYTKTTDVAS